MQIINSKNLLSLLFICLSLWKQLVYLGMGISEQKKQAKITEITDVPNSLHEGNFSLEVCRGFAPIFYNIC